MKNSHGVVAFAFGVPGTLPSNKIIAQIALEMAQRRDVSIYTQRDAGIPAGPGVYFTYEPEGSPAPPTLRIARGAIEWAIEQGISTLWISAAEPHVWRCVRDLERTISEKGALIKVCVLSGVYSQPPDVWFSSESEQVWTRSVRDWMKRDRILKIMPFFIYKWIAS